MRRRQLVAPLIHRRALRNITTNLKAAVYRNTDHISTSRVLARTVKVRTVGKTLRAEATEAKRGYIRRKIGILSTCTSDASSSYVLKGLDLQR